MLDITELKLPEIDNKTQGPKFEELKNRLLLTLFKQRTLSFNSESSPEGAWAPIKSVDAKLKKIKSFKENPNSKKSQEMKSKDKVLHDTLKLRMSFTGDATGSAHEVTDDAVKIQTNVEYAATHNFGDPKRNIPARPFNQFTDEDNDEINQILSEFFNAW